MPNEQLAARARDVAVEIGWRLKDPRTVSEIAAQGRRGSPSYNWSPHALAEGYAGTALLFNQLDLCFPRQGWANTAHEHLLIAVSGTQTSPRPISGGLFGGLAGVGFAALVLSRSEQRYKRLMLSLDRVLISSLQKSILELRHFDAGLPVRAFDLISGITGKLVYAIARRNMPDLRFVCENAIEGLAQIVVTEEGFPRCYTPPEFMSPEDSMTKEFPEGCINFGLAHGMPGIAAVLSIAMLAGFRSRTLESAIHSCAQWILRSRLEDEWGSNWPYGISLTGTGLATPGVATPNMRHKTSQAGWCYGSPGIARALHLAGKALNAPEYLQAAEVAIKSVMRRPPKARRLSSPTFCHGTAGLVQICLRFWNDSAVPALAETAEALVVELLAKFEPNDLLGYRAVASSGRQESNIGLLDGTAGVALVLLAAGCPCQPMWDRAFLLS